jgi:hypothetical protein
MTEKIDLPGGGWAEIRTALTGGDQKWWFIAVDEAKRGNGTGKPAWTGPDPDNPAVLKDYPAVPAELTTADNFNLYDQLIVRLVTGWSLPFKPSAWSAEKRDTEDLDVINALDTAITAQMRRLQGIVPKPGTSSTTSASSPPDGASAHRKG